MQPKTPEDATEPIASSAAPITPVTQAEFLAMAKKDRNPKRIIIVLVIIAVLIGAAYLVYASGLLGGMKTVKYNNGKGATFSVKFYSQNETKSLASSSASDGGEGGKSLVAKKGKDGKAPLSIYISTVNVGSDSDSSSSTGRKTIDDNSKCLGQTPVAKVHNDWVGKDVSICEINDNEGLHYIYYSTFSNKDTMLYVLITQDVDYDSIGNSPEKAKALLKTVGLEVYNEDIQQIVGSIKPE